MKARTHLRGILIGALVGLVPMASAHSAPSSPKFVQGDGTRSGGYFTAGSEGASIVVPGGARVTLEPGASVRIFPNAQRLRMPGGYATQTWSISVRKGLVRAQVKKPKKSAILLVASSKFSVVVANGSAALVVGADETAAVNEQGESHTIVDGRWSPLAERSILAVDAKGAISREATPDAPKLEVGQRLWVSTGAPVKLEGIRWSKIESADHYEVALFEQGENAPLLEQVSQGPRLDVPFRPLSGGQFEIAVRAVERRGLRSPWSERVSVRVVGVALPDGAYVSAGNIHLGQGQKARFTHAEGLLLTHSGMGRYVPATSLVPLHDNQRTMVSLRLPGTANLAITELLPRPVAARIEIGPKTARWPRDQVKVTVQLTGMQPGTVPIDIEPHPRVTIGIDPVEVDWHREGNRLEAIVPPSEQKGPWVVRVEVEDQFGVPLGRDFLEVATSR